MDPIDGQVIAITGAGTGIGAATATLLAARGARVVLGGRRGQRLEEVAAAIRGAGGLAEVVATDVTLRADVDALVARAVEAFGRLDAFVANAGVAKTGPVGDGDVAGWDAMVDVNLRGVLHAAAAALPVFRAQGRGHLVAVVSTAGLKIVPTQAVYAATKNAVRTFLEGLRQESTDGTLRVTGVSPGYVQTELASSIDDPVVRAQVEAGMAELALPADAVARAIAFALEQPEDVEVGDLVIRPTRQG